MNNVLKELEDYNAANLAGRLNFNDAESRLKKRTKLRYGFLKRRLHSLLLDLEAWHSIFDPSWYLLTRLVNGEVDHALEKNAGTDSKLQAITTVQEIRAVVRITAQEGSSSELAFLPPGYVSSGTFLTEGSTLRIASVAQTTQSVLLDSTAYQDSAEPSAVVNAVREIARLLSISDPFSLGFLKCLGIMRLTNRQFQYVFELPKQSPPKMLRSLLQQHNPSLDAKLQIAKLLARAVTSLHTANFVHKNIRPETIVVLEDDLGEMSTPYLVGFEQSRPHASHSGLFADMKWYRNLYRHPSRQGLRPQEYYNMQHDIYSLGVCLLEIGLWTSFVIFSDEEPQANPLLDLSAELELNNKTQAASKIKEKFMRIAQAELPSRMGRSYTEVVLSCLTCLDRGAANMFENEEGLYDRDGIIIGVAFIEKILVRLEDLRV